MKTSRSLLLAVTFIAVVVVIPAQAKEAKTVSHDSKPTPFSQAAPGVKQVPVPLLKGGFPGGVETVVKADLMAMQEGSYILHARGGELTKVPAQKSILPTNPGAWAHQGIRLALADDGTVYVRQPTIMCKSTDGGRNWTSHPDPATASSFQILKDGAFISVVASSGVGETDPAKVHCSRDEGRSWETIAEIPIQVPGFDYKARHTTFPMYRLPDDTLLWAIQVRNDVNHVKGKSFGPDGTFSHDKGWVSGKSMLILYRSTDGGRTWQGPFKVRDSISEGGMTVLPSGRLLATVRHQRGLYPTDPLDLADQVAKFGGSEGRQAVWSQAYKHVFLMDSQDGAKTWTNFRMLTTALGQCYGFPVSLGDGTVVVIHTSPYGYAVDRPGHVIKPPEISPQQKLYRPGVPSGRAVISHDGGQTWEDEAYYVYFGSMSGYNQSVVLKDGTILTVAALDDKDKVAIRWNPIRKQSANP